MIASNGIATRRRGSGGTSTKPAGSRSSSADGREEIGAQEQQWAAPGMMSSRVCFTISGPISAATTPPASTSEMARARASGLATSAAAKRRCWLMPSQPGRQRRGNRGRNPGGRSPGRSPGRPDRQRAAQREARPAAQAREHDAGGDRGRHHPDHLDGHRQRVQRLVHRQRVADQRGHDGLPGHHRVHQRRAENRSQTLRFIRASRPPAVGNGSTPGAPRRGAPRPGRGA